MVKLAAEKGGLLAVGRSEWFGVILGSSFAVKEIRDVVVVAVEWRYFVLIDLNCDWSPDSTPL